MFIRSGARVLIFVSTFTQLIKSYFMYVCPCIIYEIDERYQLDAKVGYKLTHSAQDYTPAPQDLKPQHPVLNTICSSIQPVLLKMGI